MPQRLNDDDIEPVKPSDVQRFRELLAEDSLCALPDCTVIDCAQFPTNAAKAEDAALRRVSHRY